jgi:hypothetical protein
LVDQQEIFFDETGVAERPDSMITLAEKSEQERP